MLSSHPGMRIRGQSPQTVAFGSPSTLGMISEGQRLCRGQLEVQGRGCRAVHSHKDSSKDFLGEAVSPLLFFRGDVNNCRNNQEGEGKFFLLLTSLGAVVPQVFLHKGNGSQKDLAEHFYP